MILERIAKQTGVSVRDLIVTVQSANHLYKTYTIPKRTGGRRVISHPTPELKFLQRWMNRNLFSYLPIHDAVYSYKRGVGIFDNALPHVRRNYLLKIDFADFFPSLKADDVGRVINANADKFTPDLAGEDVQIVLKTVCRRGVLAIGAPSSPTLSNAILYEFDCLIFDACRAQEVVYTRYADDIYMSTNKANRLSGLLELIRSDLKARPSPRLTINERKTVFTSRKRKRVVAGLVLTSDGKISIGRLKKRQIRSNIYQYTKGALAIEDVSYLRGYLAFVNSVEPQFIENIRRKFGSNTIDQLMLETTVPRKPQKHLG